MIQIDLLKHHPHAIPTLANIWCEALGKIWMPEVSVEESQSLYYEELKQDMPITYIALYNETPVGSCTLELHGGIRPDLKPWIGDLVITPNYQNKGIGKILLDTTIKKAQPIGFDKVYLFTFDPEIPNYYQRLGWKTIGMDEFKSKPVTVMERWI